MIFKRLNEEAILDLTDVNDLKNQKNVTKILDKIAGEFKNEQVFKNNKDLIADSIVNFNGHSDPSKNKFLNMMMGAEANNKNGFRLMYQLYSSNEIDLEFFDKDKIHHNWASLKSFYDRESNEAIKYKARIFDIVSNPVKLKKFFQNIDDIHISDLYINTDTVKKASLNNLKDKNGVYYQVAKWDSENEQPDKDKAKLDKEKLKKLNDDARIALNKRIEELKTELDKVLKDPTRWIDVSLEIDRLNDELSNLK